MGSLRVCDDPATVGEEVVVLRRVRRERQPGQVREGELEVHGRAAGVAQLQAQAQALVVDGGGQGGGQRRLLKRKLRHQAVSGVLDAGEAEVRLA